jgi:C-terminal processing protease CtpA/Prc
MTKEDYNNVTSQKSGGFGFSCQDVTAGCHVTFVRIDSPADKVGLKRGDIISKINNTDATHANIYKKGKELEKLVNFSVIRKNSNEECNCSVTPRDYTYKVAKGKTIKTPKNEKVGYFRLDSFMGAENIVSQIDTAFDNFKKENIKKLVIDLRYNGGGSVTVASKLLDKLSTTQTNKEQFTLAWNDDFKQNNSTYRFAKDNNSLNLEQILFLTTKGSASASELVISAMKPYLSSENVVIIGDKTHGKPVGMGGKTDGSYYYFLINFVVKNSLGFYDYFEGLPLTEGCAIDDDPLHDMGDPKESMLKAALHYVDTGACQ